MPSFPWAGRVCAGEQRLLAYCTVRSLHRSQAESAGEESHEAACALCGSEEGELLLCDGCPCVYHLPCCGLRRLPDGASMLGDDSSALSCSTVQVQWIAPWRLTRCACSCLLQGSGTALFARMGARRGHSRGGALVAPEAPVALCLRPVTTRTALA